MKRLHLSPDLSLPSDVAGEAIGVLATRGAGKSYTSADLVEELWKAKVQFAVLDPTGVYWGLRAAANGRDEGLPVIVLGGAHGDVPLEPTAGKLIADLLVDTGQSLILDLSDFESKGAQTRFVTDLAERLYTRKARARTTLHLVIDEAHEFAPQKPMRDEARMLGAMERLVGRGRSRGIGTTLITQRSATLNKNVLDLIDTLIAMRVLSPRDRGAVKDWITAKEERDELGVLDSLPSLPTGTAWVWSPVRGILKKVVMRRIRTFDSYATPKPGEVRAEPRALAAIDVAQLGEQITATRDRAKAEDPKELQKLLREKQREVEGLHREISELQARGEREVEIPVEVEVPVLVHLDLSRAWAKLAEIDADVEAVRALLELAGEEATKRARAGQSTVVPLPKRATSQSTRERPNARQPQAQPPVPVRERPAPRDSGRIAGPNGLTGPERKILDAIAWWEVVGYPKPTKQQVGIIAGYRVGKRVGGHYGNTLGGLKAAGLIDYPSPGTTVLTEEGREHANAVDVAGTTDALQAEVLSRCSGPERKILEVLIEVYPDALHKQELGERAGYTVGDRVGGHFGNILGKLRTLGLIDYPSPGTASADPVLFLEQR